MSASNRIGRCRFSELPARYQDIFRNSGGEPADRIFIAEKNPESILLAIPLSLLFGSIPLILMYEYQQVVGAWYRLGWILPAIVVGLGVRAVVRLFEHYRNCREGASQYGLLVDREGLAMNQLVFASSRPSVYIPLANIRRIYSQSEGGGSGGGYRGMALKVAFTDHAGKPQTIKLGTASSLVKPPYVLDELLTEFIAETGCNADASRPQERNELT
ncbi:MAG TPA: hypothetical protein DDW52_09060 [Planctomycetaceae bacterium]|nr:hypothetical protein [Planctomycetaceae bacterium]